MSEDWYNSKIKPMLATKGKPFDSSEFIFEPKWDGTRCIAFVNVDNGVFRLQNRRFADITTKYPELELTDFLKENAILDGEIVVFEGGKPSFEALQSREQLDSKMKIEILSKIKPAIYFVFDILYLKSKGWLLDLPLSERRKLLEEVTKKTIHVILSEYIVTQGKKFFEVSVNAGLEGVIAKKIDSKYYLGKRTDFWKKIKGRRTLDAVILGWVEGNGKRKMTFGSLILGLNKNGKFRYIGRVGSGFTNKFLSKFSVDLKSIEIRDPHFSGSDVNFSNKRRIHWVSPDHVCKVEYFEITSEKRLRAPVFLRLRNDKLAEECTYDQLE